MKLETEIRHSTYLDCKTYLFRIKEIQNTAMYFYIPPWEKNKLTLLFFKLLQNLQRTNTPRNQIKQLKTELLT